MYKVYQSGYVFHVPDEAYKGEIERGHSQPFRGDEKILQEFLKLHPDRNRMMIDVGGHIGLFAIPYSKYFLKIYSYEPQDENFSYLTKNIAENYVGHVVTPIKKAVMRSVARVNIVAHAHNSLCEVPKYSGMYTAVPNDTGQVRAIELDNEYLYHAIDFIKIDVEGQELSVLKSAKKILKEQKPFLQIEINPKITFMESHKQEIFDYLTSLGYMFYKKDVDYFFI